MLDACQLFWFPGHRGPEQQRAMSARCNTTEDSPFRQCRTAARLQRLPVPAAEGMSWEQADVDRPAVLRAVLRHQRATALAWPLVALARSRTPDLAMASQWDQKQAHRVPHHPDL
ncbi:uncharacterized protein LOC144115626 isoform X2 [Amblyomma americanum]